jgi:hypothetical protein
VRTWSSDILHPGAGRRHRSARARWTAWFAIALSTLAALPSASDAVQRHRDRGLPAHRRGVRPVRSREPFDCLGDRRRTRASHIAPLLTEEVLLSGDLIPMATGLEARLQNVPALAEALRTANITSHEYTKFTLALVAARLAQGFRQVGRAASGPRESRRQRGVRRRPQADIDACAAGTGSALASRPFPRCWSGPLLCGPQTPRRRPRSYPARRSSACRPPVTGCPPQR